MDALLGRYARLRVAVVSDVLDALGHRAQVMAPGIRPLGGAQQVVGRAATLLVHAVDRVPEVPYRTQFEAVDRLQPDEVLVASAPPVPSAFWGELITTRAMVRGCAGAVVDGYTRDLAAIRTYRFPLWARGTHPADSAGRLEGVEIGGVIRCAGVEVRQGDIVLGDLDGVVVVPAPLAQAVAEAAEIKASKEDEVRGALREGISAAEAFSRYRVM